MTLLNYILGAATGGWNENDTSISIIFIGGALWSLSSLELVNNYSFNDTRVWGLVATFFSDVYMLFDSAYDVYSIVFFWRLWKHLKNAYSSLINFFSKPSLLVVFFFFFFGGGSLLVVLIKNLTSLWKYHKYIRNVQCCNYVNLLFLNGQFLFEISYTSHSNPHIKLLHLHFF